MTYFEYGSKETEYLSIRDAVLAEAISIIGTIEREVNPDLFSALVDSILGQQISRKAKETVSRRMSESLTEITPKNILALSESELQAFGISFRKAGYIREAALAVDSGAVCLASLSLKSDAEVIAELTKLPGIGVWTAEMLLLFSLGRPDIISYGDLGIQRGLCRLYQQDKISREEFAVYRNRYSPYASVASLYLWEVAAISNFPESPSSLLGRALSI